MPCKVAAFNIKLCKHAQLENATLEQSVSVVVRGCMLMYREGMSDGSYDNGVTRHSTAPQTGNML